MKFFLIITVILSLFVFAVADVSNISKDEKVKKQIELEMEKERKYSIEQKFYQGAEYDLSDSEVNPDSIDSVPDLEIQDFDMDSVYD
jgi:hypothetical protein